MSGFSFKNVMGFVGAYKGLRRGFTKTLNK